MGVIKATGFAGGLNETQALEKRSHLMIRPPAEPGAFSCERSQYENGPARMAGLFFCWCGGGGCDFGGSVAGDLEGEGRLADLA